jgi:hypothetical protein
MAACALGRVCVTATRAQSAALPASLGASCRSCTSCTSFCRHRLRMLDRHASLPKRAPASCSLPPNCCVVAAVAAPAHVGLYFHFPPIPSALLCSALLCSALSLRSAACPETALTPWLLAYSPVCWACTWFDWASLPPSPASRRISHHARLIPYTLPLLRPGHTRSLLTRALEPRLPAASFVLCYLPTSPFVAPNCLPSFAVSGRALLS